MWGRIDVSLTLGFGRARTAGLDFAFGTFIDVPVGAGVTHVAVPEDESGVGFDDLEGVLALARFRHCCCDCQCWRVGAVKV